MIDVSQGDSALIITPNRKKVIVIDVGGKLVYKQDNWEIKNKNYYLSDTLISFYRSLGIKKIDYMFLTHGDDDHAGEAKRITDNIDVKNVIINKGDENHLEIEIKFKKTIQDKVYKIDNIKLTSLNNKDYNEENDNSIVLLLEVENKKILFMGDATIKTEKDIMKKTKTIRNIDILKVGHHGSTTSSSKEFIKYTNPQTSIISVGENNRFNHPREEVLYILKDSNILRTDKIGTIKYKICNNNKK